MRQSHGVELIVVEIELQSFVDEIKPLLKNHGFLKRRLTWTRDAPDTIVVFNIQRSSWNKSDFYINLGVYVKTLGDLASPTESQCHIRQRIWDPSPSEAFEQAESWLTARSSMDDIQTLHREGKLSEKSLVSKSLVELCEQFP